MRCEVCGKNMSQQPIKVKIDGSVMDVCNECSKFGKRIRQAPIKTSIKSRKSKVPQNTQKKVYNERIEEIVEDYNDIVRAAREKRDWNREELAKKINEKLSVVSKIENRKMEPDLKLAKKIEKALNIKLIETSNQSLEQEVKASSLRKATLGDIMKVKRK